MQVNQTTTIAHVSCLMNPLLLKKRMYIKSSSVYDRQMQMQMQMPNTKSNNDAVSIPPQTSPSNQTRYQIRVNIKPTPNQTKWKKLKCRKYIAQEPLRNA
jgi:hypothetical protein